MSILEIVARAKAYLQEHARVSVRALRLEFGLDDDQLQLSEDEAEAELLFHQALNVAQAQETRSFELRIATNLAHLWQKQGKQDEARALLAPVYDWFTEGFETLDLKDAKALLDELA